MNPFPLIGAIVGGLAGVLAWVVAAAFDGGTLGGLALVVGGGVAGGAMLLGARRNSALMVAVLTLVLCLVAKGAIFLVTAQDLRAQQAVSITYTETDYGRFMDDAAEFTKVQPGAFDAFMAGRKPYDINGDGSIVPAERERFERFWAPRLREWVQRPPAMTDWAPKLRSDLGPEGDVKIDYAPTLAAVFSVWALFLVLVAVAGAHQLVARFSGDDIAELDRDDKIVAGVIDLNADVGTPMDIHLAAPGQKAARAEIKITDRVRRARAGRPTGHVRRLPPPRNEQRDQPPGMK